MIISQDQLGKLAHAQMDLKTVVDQLSYVGDPWTNHIAEMPINHNPFHPDILRRKMKFWYIRELIDIKGITIHHTMSHSPLATAKYCCFTKGYPTGQYAFWVSQGDGCPVYQLADLSWIVWHDNTGAYQSNISVGMAGDLSVKEPPQEQIDATANLVAYLMCTYSIPIDNVEGHRGRWRGTDCPGWDLMHWRNKFYDKLESLYLGK